MYRFVKINFPVTLTENIWKTNPQLKYIPPFSELYNSDSSEEHKQSSDIMTSIILYTDPRYENKIYRLEEQLKISTIKAFCEDFDLENDLITKCIIAYPDCCLTPAARAFIREEKELSKRTDYMEQTPYVKAEAVRDKNGAIVYVSGKPMMIEGTVRELEMMKKNTLAIYKQYEQVKKIFEEEQKGEIRIHGGGEETLMDEGGFQEIEED
jgi:NAD(P)H-flavin reductase